MKKTKQNIKLWEYLDSIGVLVDSKPDEILLAKKNYARLYQRNYKKVRRLKEPEFTIHFPKQSQDYQKLERAAKAHKMAITNFIKHSTLCYISKTYLKPRLEVFYKIEQLLADCSNHTKAIASQKEKYNWDREAKYQVIETRIMQLETELRALMYAPPAIEEYIQEAIEKDNSLKDRLRAMLV